ncbi:hypothetical protein [Nocardioides flavescens]|uniref:PknH-like extracellular domain-containing protein n=1 Tax=Nocardioides flavescens TaxID=2691959 RepID=A0A6L7F4H6_9ACTN|nr:hypothetical protein [Nocardioides flavescens]MXG92104.1 hypothetical protein [Nocardioides flavescens]
MPDLSDLDDFLDDFQQGGSTVHRMSPAQVRRRGDRIRRRRTAGIAAGGVLVAALAVGAPIAALTGPGDDRGSMVATDVPSATPTAPPDGWAQAIPAEFPITDGMPTSTTVGADALEGDPGVPAGCRTTFEGYVDDLSATYQGVGSEDRQVRDLVLFPDATSAQAWLDGVRAAVASCPEEAVGSDTTLVHAVDPVDLGGDEGWRLTQQVRQADGLVSDLTLTLVTRVGNAVLTDYSSGSAGGEQAVDLETTRLVEASTPVREALCAFAVEPCG